MIKISRPLDQLEDICRRVLSGCEAIKKKCLRETVIEILTLYMIIPRRINFTQMERYGSHDEQTYRNTFKKDVDWSAINMWIINQLFPKGHRIAIAIDPSYISKAGKCTAHIGRFWSGCAQMVKHGLEILGIGVIDIDMNPSQCLAFGAAQTPNSAELTEKNMTLDKFYLSVIENNIERLLSVSKYIVADAWFSKKPFADGITKLGFHLISRFRDDADLRYIYTGERTGKPGRPRVYDGKIDFDNLDYSRMTEFEVSGETDKFYTLIAYSYSLKKNVRLVIRVTGKGKHKLYFSTDTEISGKDVLEFYRGRFQVEFVFRDSKQYAGLCHCQARSEEKLDFGFNASLTSVNVAKFMMKEIGMDYSMANFKNMIFNAFLINRFIAVSGYRPNSDKINKTFKELIEGHLQNHVFEKVR